MTEFPIIDPKVPPTPRVLYLDSGLAIFSVPSTPEGVVSAAPGSFAISTAGIWYRKATGFGPTGWVPNIGGGGASNVIITSIPTVISAESVMNVNLPANSLASDKDYVRFQFAGAVAANSNSKLIILLTGIVGQPLVQVLRDPQSVVVSSTQGGTIQSAFSSWRVTGEIQRLNSQAFIFSAQLIVGDGYISVAGVPRGNGSSAVSRQVVYTNFPGGQTLTTAQVIINVEATNAPDVTLLESIVEMYNVQ